MTTEEFQSLSKQELLNGARAAIKQARALYTTAQNAATAQNYGVANSLMILSVEETIKTMILLAGFLNVKLEFDIRPFFSNHKFKHFQAAEMQPMINAIWKIRSLFIDIVKGKGSVMSALIGALIIHAIDKFGPSDVPPVDFTTWWSEANNQKNNGFYVGYFNKQWSYPSKIDETKYLETLRMAKPFIECLEIAESLKEEDYKILEDAKLGLRPIN